MTRVLFVCGKARKRSPTAFEVARGWSCLEPDFAGLSKDADELIMAEHVAWADVIMVMEPRHKQRLKNAPGGMLTDTKVVTLGIPDRFEFMDDVLVDRLREILRHHFGPPDFGAKKEAL